MSSYVKNTHRRFYSILVTSLGSFLEWFDYGTFTYLIYYLTLNFFPVTHKGTPFLISYTLIIFGIGMVFRSLGGLFFGYLGDRVGRKKTLVFSLLLITVTLFVTAFLPTYAMIGWWAPCLLLFMRMIQSFSLAGEYPGIFVTLVEYNSFAKGRFRRGVTGSLTSFFGNTGIFFASLILLLLNLSFSQHFILHLGWRIPFFINACLSLSFLFLRYFMQESPFFTQINKKNTKLQSPLFSLWVQHKKTIVRYVLLMIFYSSIYWLTAVFLISYIQSTNAQSSKIHSLSLISTLSLALYPIFCLLGGFVSDYIGRKRLLRLVILYYLIFSIPLLYFVFSLHLSVFLLFLIVPQSLAESSIAISLAESFPTSYRYTGTGITFNLPFIVTGFLPALSQTLIVWTHSYFILGLLIAFVALCAFIMQFFLKDHTFHSLQE